MSGAGAFLRAYDFEKQQTFKNGDNKAFSVKKIREEMPITFFSNEHRKKGNYQHGGLPLKRAFPPFPRAALRGFGANFSSHPAPTWCGFFCNGEG